MNLEWRHDSISDVTVVRCSDENFFVPACDYYEILLNQPGRSSLNQAIFLNDEFKNHILNDELVNHG